MSKVSFWGKYDIRAVVNDHFGAVQYHQVGRAFAAYLEQKLTTPKNEAWVSVGHDARLHSPELTQALITGLTESGINVVSLGLSTSPMVYFSEYLSEIDPAFPAVVGTITVTASHNPSEYNGMKFTFQKSTLSEADFHLIQDLYHKQTKLESSPAQQLGIIRSHTIIQHYTDWFQREFGKVGQGIKIVVDSGNATAGIVAPEVLRLLGCDVVDIFTEPDGRFPNHHPDPCVHKNLVFLMDKVKEVQADFGVAFDGDADRLGLVDNQGKIVPGDQITLFLLDEVLQEQPNATIVFDIKSTQTLQKYIEERHGKYMLAPSGHVFIKHIMKKLDIPLGGELSGHIFFRDKHWGFDDALYAACRLISAFAKRRQQRADFKFSDFVAALPQTLISEEIRVACTRQGGQALIDELQNRLEQNPDYFGSPVIDVLTIDGLRINIDNGFFLMRASNTEPCITIRFEAPDEALYSHMQQCIEDLCLTLQRSPELISG